MFERINNIKNRPLKAEPDPWVIDHNNAVDCDANNAKTNKSANITWYQGCPSADTFTLIENQNQNPEESAPTPSSQPLAQRGAGYCIFTAAGGQWGNLHVDLYEQGGRPPQHGQYHAITGFKGGRQQNKRVNTERRGICHAEGWKDKTELALFTWWPLHNS